MEFEVDKVDAIADIQASNVAVCVAVPKTLTRRKKIANVDRGGPARTPNWIRELMLPPTTVFQ